MVSFQKLEKENLVTKSQEKKEEKKTFQPSENHRSLDDVTKEDDNFDEDVSVPDRYDDW